MAAFHYVVELFVPLQSCPCNFQNIIDEIFALLLPFKEFVDFAVKDAGSNEADELNIIGITIRVKDLGTNREILRTQRIPKLKTLCSELFTPIKNRSSS